MKLDHLLLLLTLLFLAGCAPGITSIEQALQEIQDLDSKYSTNFRDEMMNKLILGTAEIDEYLTDLEALRKRVSTEENEKKHVEWLFELRKQMLISQKEFQLGWFGVGDKGRVSDGFTCNDFQEIQEASTHFDRAWSFGVNATGIMDALLTANEFMKEAIGVGDNKVLFYSSDFESLFVELQSNVVAMERFCEITIEVQYVEFVNELEVLNG